MKASRVFLPLLCLVSLSTGCMAWMARTEIGGSDWRVYKGVGQFVELCEDGIPSVKGTAATRLNGVFSATSGAFPDRDAFPWSCDQSSLAVRWTAHVNAQAKAEKKMARFMVFILPNGDSCVCPRGHCTRNRGTMRLFDYSEGDVVDLRWNAC